MRVLGLDPGATTGWGVIELPGASSGLPRVVACGSFRVENERAGDDALADLLDALPLDSVIAVECIEGMAYPAKGGGIVPSLLRAKGVEARMRRTCDIWLAPRRTLDLPAGVWKRALFGKNNVDDSLVARLLPMHLRDIPRTNEHARDALGLAVAAGKRTWRRF